MLFSNQDQFEFNREYLKEKCRAILQEKNAAQPAECGTMQKVAGTADHPLSGEQGNEWNLESSEWIHGWISYEILDKILDEAQEKKYREK